MWKKVVDEYGREHDDLGFKENYLLYSKEHGVFIGYLDRYTANIKTRELKDFYWGTKGSDVFIKDKVIYWMEIPLLPTIKDEA